MPSITITDALEGGTLMSFDEKTLSISSKEFEIEIDGEVMRFSPARELSSAFEKLTAEKQLSFMEEYSVESLYHEHLHAQNKTTVQKGSIDEVISEASTQLYAREKYVKILSHYGVEPVNHENIKKNGLGYQTSCNLIRDLFTKDGVMQVGELINIVNGSQSGQRIVENKLKNRGYSEMEIREFFEKIKPD